MIVCPFTLSKLIRRSCAAHANPTMHAWQAGDISQCQGGSRSCREKPHVILLKPRLHYLVTRSVR